MILRPPKAKPSKTRFALEVLTRLPLAEAFYSSWTFLAPDSVLEELFAEHRGRCYEAKLSFAEIVGLLTEAITRYQGSGHSAISTALERQQLSSKARAVYGKLARLPLPLAEALLVVLTARLRTLFPVGLCRTALPTCLTGLTVVVLDGKTIKKAAKRLLATRGRPGKLHGGKLLVAYLPGEGLAVAVAADPDGEANDLRLMPRVMPLARQAVAGRRLWVVDSQFCDLDQTARFCEDGDHFLARFTQRNSFEVDPARPAQTGVNRSGQAYRQVWGWMGSAKDKRRRYVRQLTVQRPGEEDVVVVTDLLEESAYPAVELLGVYLTRWQIETVFQQITEVFALNHLIGCTPEATVFQASLCLVIYNLLQVLRGYAAQSQEVNVEVLSTEKIFKDLHEQLVSLHTVLKVEELLPCLEGQPAPAEQTKQRLKELLGRAWSDNWKKAVNKKPRTHQPKAKQSGAHTSVHKLLQQAKLSQAKQDKSTPQSNR
jgi:hypothetical protein